MQPLFSLSLDRQQLADFNSTRVTLVRPEIPVLSLTFSCHFSQMRSFWDYMSEFPLEMVLYE